MSNPISDLVNGKYRRSQSNVGLAVAMLFVGVAVGALTALLVSPKTGKQLRRTLRRKFEDAREAMGDFGDQASDWMDKGSEWADKAKTKVAPLAKPFQK